MRGLPTTKYDRCEEDQKVSRKMFVNTKQIVSEFIERSRKRDYKQTKWCQETTLSKLIATRQSKSMEEVNRKWGVNLSKHQLTQNKTSLLAKGLNYVVAPEQIPYEEYVVATELAFLYPKTTWGPPWCLLCDVIWAPPGRNTSSVSPYDVIEQPPAGSQEFADLLQFNQWQLP